MIFGFPVRPPITDLLNTFLHSCQLTLLSHKQGMQEVHPEWDSGQCFHFPMGNAGLSYKSHMARGSHLSGKQWPTTPQEVLFLPCFVWYCGKPCFDKYTGSPGWPPSSLPILQDGWPKSGQTPFGCNSHGPWDPKASGALSCQGECSPSCAANIQCFKY